jgi:uncharacterized protein (TIGR02246 family)
MRSLQFSVALVLAGAAPPGSWAAEGAAADDQAIRKVADAFAAAWNRHDPKAMAALFTPDGDVVTPYGQFLKGRPAVEAQFMREQVSWAKDVTLTTTIDGLRLIKPDVALVDGTVSAAGARELDGKITTLRGRFTNVMVLRDGQWQFLARRVLLVAPEPVAAPAKK